MVCSRRVDSARPLEGTECARVAVDTTDSRLSVRWVAVYSMWLLMGQLQARAVSSMHPPHTTIVSEHGSDLYIV
eukprot:7056666-Prymnesium_polylepis.1